MNFQKNPMSNVKLIWATPDAESLITKMARVSAPANQDNMDTAPRLLKYLIKHKHWSPYEMANLCVEIETTRGISAQILRHRSFSFQEFSQRYADVSALGSSEIPHLRRQDTKNRQNSIDDLSSDVIAGYYRRIGHLFEDAEHLYREMVSAGVAKECARSVLPIATQTRMYMNGTLRSYIHYLQVRCDESTQLEHRQIAEQIKDIFCEQFPIIGEAVFSAD
jgi:thymidylate synthase (FAD)